MLPVHAWRLVSRFLPARCKYYPSCSTYALTAIRRHGVLHGSRLAVWRVLRCNPWSLGGVDYVPPRSGHHPSECGSVHEHDAAPPSESL
ncbi:MAG: membrane protein insertion efficiency factor YidD [Salinibacterium sp.]|nr:membrane protein insertion efficiency factor YidD [Salinibacterium sp.]